MLVRRRVEHELRPVFRENLLQPLPVAHGRDLHREGKILPVPVQQVVLQLIGRVLRHVEDHEPLRPVRRDLAAELRADRPAAARHEHGLAAQERPDARIFQLHRRAAEQILDLHLAHGGDIVALPRVQPRDGAAEHMDAPLRAGAEVQNLLPPLGREILDGENDVRDGRVGEDFLHRVDRPEHRDAVDAFLLLFRRVVNDAVRAVAPVNPIIHLRDESRARRSRADDSRIGPRPAADTGHPPPVAAVDEPVPQHHQQRQRRPRQG